MSSIEKTLQERGARYGKFSDHARISQRIQKVFRSEQKRFYDVVPAWASLSDVQQQALTVIADKIARILSGDPDYIDNWHDIQGYAKLVEDDIIERLDNSH